MAGDSVALIDASPASLVYPYVNVQFASEALGLRVWECGLC